MSKTDSTLTLLKMMSFMMPEEVLIDKAIEALKEYKEEKFGEVKTPTSDKEGLGSLKEFFSKGKEITSTNKEKVVEPVAQLMSLLIKWQNTDKNPEEIFKDLSTPLEKE